MYCYGEVVVVVGQGGEGLVDFVVEMGWEFGFYYLLVDLCVGFGQGVDVVDVQGVQGCVDMVVEVILFEEVMVGLGGGGKFVGYGNVGIGQVVDYFVEGCVFVFYMFYIMDVEFIEGNYVFY